ncbi:MAG: serine/threonine protein kinase [Acidimicrobiia bacterium]|nr:serine/threonine protein kinase [Acidimicrobiia bacterium]
MQGRILPALVTCLLLLAGATAARRSDTAGTTVRMVESAGEGAKYWPRWRGPSGQGLATGAYPDRWSPDGPFRWKVRVPGRGNSSPIVWGDRLFLTTAHDNGQRLALLCYRRSDGALLWELPVPRQTREGAHYKNGYASGTPVADGTRVYASFGGEGIVAADFSGREVWRQRFGAIGNFHGAAGSPVLHDGRVMVFHDGDAQAFVAALDAATGTVLWKTPRSESVGWGTPIVVRAGSRDELIVSGQHRVYAYDPATGRELWRVNGNTWEVVPTPVVAHNLVFASSGRAGPTLAIRPGGSGDITRTHVAWSTPRGSPFVPSGIVVGDVLYLVNDMQSIVTAFEARTGALLFQNRLGQARREGFTASPVAAGGRVFFTNDEGETFVLRAGRAFDLLHVNQIGEDVLASPALVDGVWYVRTASSLVAIG